MSTVPPSILVEVCKDLRDEVRVELDKANASIAILEASLAITPSKETSAQLEDLMDLYEMVEKKYDQLNDQIEFLESLL